MFGFTYKRLCGIIIFAIGFVGCTPQPWDIDANIDLSGNHGTAHKEETWQYITPPLQVNVEPSKDTGTN